MATNLTHFYSEFTIEKQLAFVKVLEGKDNHERYSMLNSRKKKKLLRDIQAGKLVTYLDFFEYCHGCYTIHITPYNKIPEKLLKKLIKPVNDIIFNAFTIIDINITKQPFSGTPSYDDTIATLQINTGDQIYTHTYTLKATDTTTAYNLKNMLTNLLVAINQLLAAYNQTYRLTGVTNSDIDEKLLQINNDNYVICLVNPYNLKVFDFYKMQHRFMFNQPMIVHFTLPLSYKNIQYALYHFTKCGLLSHINDIQLKPITDQLYAGIYEHVGDLLKTFPDTIIAVNRTLVKGQKPYRDFLLALNNVSRGVLNFTDITDNSPEDVSIEPESNFEVTFSCNGNLHQMECSSGHNEFNDSIIYYIINKIIRKEYKNYQLLQLIHSDHQKDIYLFAPNEQINYLTKMKLRESFDRF